MKSSKIILPFLFTFILMTGCKKEEYPTTPAPEAPEFVFNGTIDGSSVALQAGTDNYYMFTSYSLDANGVYDYSGEFRDKNCASNCPKALKISFKDYRPANTGVTIIDSAVTTGFYSFATPIGTPSLFYVQFTDTIVNGNAQSYFWNFGDGTTSYIHRPVHIYRRPGVYTVTLTTQTTGCSSSIKNNIVIGQSGNAFQPELSLLKSSGDTVFLSGSPGMNHLTDLVVDFGDGTSTTPGTSTANLKHRYATPGTYTVTMTATDTSGYKAVARLNVGTETTPGCYTNFRVKWAVPAPNQINLNNVTIEWRDAGGNIYTSADFSQPMRSVFNIVSVEDYQNNINGQPTKKIHAIVSCRLFKGFQSINLSGDVVFSIAHL